MEDTVTDVIEVVVVESVVDEPTVTDTIGGVDTRDEETVDGDDVVTIDAVGGAELLGRESVGGNDDDEEEKDDDMGGEDEDDPETTGDDN